MKKFDIIERVEVGDILDPYSFTDIKVQDMIERLKFVVERVPEACRDSLRMEYETVDTYDGLVRELTFYYRRKETDEEFNARP